MSNGWFFWEVAEGDEGGGGSRCTVGVLFWNIHWYVDPCGGWWENAWVGIAGGGYDVFWWQFTSWQLWLRRRHPPPPLAAVDATARWGDGGWPACRTSVSARRPWLCFPPGSSQWRRSCQSYHNPALWSQRGFSVKTERKNYNQVPETMTRVWGMRCCWTHSRIRDSAFISLHLMVPSAVRWCYSRLCVEIWTVTCYFRFLSLNWVN